MNIYQGPTVRILDAKITGANKQVSKKNNSKKDRGKGWVGMSRGMKAWNKIHDQEVHDKFLKELDKVRGI